MVKFKQMKAEQVRKDLKQCFPKTKCYKSFRHGFVITAVRRKKPWVKSVYNNLILLMSTVKT